MEAVSSRPTIADAEALGHGSGLARKLADCAARNPSRPYLVDHDRSVTAGELDRRASAVAAEMEELGVTARSRVAVSLPVSVDHVAVIFALLRLGAVWVPLNPQLTGSPLQHQLDDSSVRWVITETRSALAEELSPGEAGQGAHRLGGSAGLAVIPIETGSAPPQVEKDTCLLMYTSGTTGPPKGVLVSESMLQAAVLGTQYVTEPRPGDVFYVWEPFFHIGGAQMIFLPLLEEVQLALAPRFSASRFWNDIRQFDVTHIHYLGGVLQILLQLDPTPAERENRVRVAWGAGATPALRKACAERFDFGLRECYGMTETSSIVTVAGSGPDGGIGQALPWFEVMIADSSGRPAGEGEPGEILVRGCVPGVLTVGYLGNDAATAAVQEGEWFRTGDRGRQDENGSLHFLGRNSDSIRVRGESISAWQIEDIFSGHPEVDRCAVVGVDAEVGEQDMLLCVSSATGADVDLSAILDWGARRLARFQVPRYAKVVESMPLTPSQRVAKHRLSRSLDGATRSRGS